MSLSLTLYERTVDVSAVQLLVSKLHNYRQGMQPCGIEERLPTDVEAECQSEKDGSERRGGSKLRGSSVQRGRRTTCPSTPPLSR